MGEASLRREFAARPPQGPMNTIKDLWRDYMRRYVNSGRGDPALPYTAAAPTLKQAIHRACMSRGEDGKLWFHQGRVWQVNLEAYEVNLLANWKRIRKMTDFDDLYKLCMQIAEVTHGIGIVTAYDVCDRLAAWLDLEPDYLYFHAGVTEGLRALGVEIPRGADKLSRDELPEFFRDKNLGIAESFLCGYRSEIERVMGAKK